MNRKEKYNDLLMDERWIAKRNEIYTRDSYRCKVCGLGNRIVQVHHKVYYSRTDPWDYPNHLLITVCEKCHKQIHDTTKIKTIPNKNKVKEDKRQRKLRKFKIAAELTKEKYRHLV